MTSVSVGGPRDSRAIQKCLQRKSGVQLNVQASQSLFISLPVKFGGNFKALHILVNSLFRMLTCLRFSCTLKAPYSFRVLDRVIIHFTSLNYFFFDIIIVVGRIGGIVVVTALC